MARAKHVPMPLDCLDPEHRAHIAELVAQPKPPPKWLNNGIAQIMSRAYYEWHLARGRDVLNERNRLSPHLRQRIIDRDGFVCGICGCDVDPTDVHIDHILPWSLGGSDSEDNLRVTHSRCNLSKGARV